MGPLRLVLGHDERHAMNGVVAGPLFSPLQAASKMLDRQLEAPRSANAGLRALLCVKSPSTRRTRLTPHPAIAVVRFRESSGAQREFDANGVEWKRYLVVFGSFEKPGGERCVYIARGDLQRHGVHRRCLHASTSAEKSARSLSPLLEEYGVSASPACR